MRYWAVLLGAFVTSFYSFRLLYLTFHGKERFHDPVPDHYIAPEADSTEHEDAMSHAHDAHDDVHGDSGHGHDDHGHAHTPHESPWVVTRAADPARDPVDRHRLPHRRPDAVRHRLAGHEKRRRSSAVRSKCCRSTTCWRSSREHWHGPLQFALHGFMAPAFWLAFAGFALATFMYLFRPDLPGKIAHALRWPVRVLEHKYCIDDLWIDGFAGGGVALGQASRAVDSRLIDGVAVERQRPRGRAACRASCARSSPVICTTTPSR